MDWVFHLYTNVKLNRIPAIKTLQTAKKITASTLTKKELDNVINALNRIDTDVVNESVILITEAKKGLAAQMKINGLRGIQNDFYEFQIRAKATTTEIDQLYLMRQINARMTLLQDAMDEGDMSESERKKWYKVYEDYESLRRFVMNKKISTGKMGLWYDYSLASDEGTPDIKYSMYT